MTPMGMPGSSMATGGAEMSSFSTRWTGVNNIHVAPFDHMFISQFNRFTILKPRDANSTLKALLNIAIEFDYYTRSEALIEAIQLADIMGINHDCTVESLNAVLGDDSPLRAAKEYGTPQVIFVRKSTRRAITPAAFVQQAQWVGDTRRGLVTDPLLGEGVGGGEQEGMGGRRHPVSQLTLPLTTNSHLSTKLLRVRDWVPQRDHLHLSSTIGNKEQLHCEISHPIGVPFCKQ